MSDWAAVTRTRWTGVAVWEARAQDLLAKKGPLWKLMAELYDLAITDLDPVLSTMQDMGNQVRCRAELRECLSAVEDIVGIFNVGGSWGRHTAVDLRFFDGPSHVAARSPPFESPYTHLDGSPVKVWAPLSQGWSHCATVRGGKAGDLNSALREWPLPAAVGWLPRPCQAAPTWPRFAQPVVLPLSERGRLGVAIALLFGP